MSEPLNAKEAARRQLSKQISRGLVAGYVDAYALLTYSVYTTFMSGNTVITGLEAGRWKLATAGHNLLPIPFFLLGTSVGAMLNRAPRAPSRLPLTLITSLLLVCSCLVETHTGAPQWLSIPTLSTSMGILATSISHVGGQSASFGYVTGDLKTAGEHLASGIQGIPVKNSQGPWDTHWFRAGILLSIWTSFLLGAFVGSEAARRLGTWTLLLPVGALIAITAFEHAPVACER
jgi:uncharacterized membrane protein YoaK (UPF0700 family)